MNYIDYLIMSKQHKTAAEWCSKIKMSAKTWEEKILIFAKEGKLDVFFWAFRRFLKYIKISIISFIKIGNLRQNTVESNIISYDIRKSFK